MASRREFLRGVSSAAFVAPFAALGASRSCDAAERAGDSASLSTLPAGAPAQALVGGPCDGCDAMYVRMPDALDWRTRIAPEEEPGEPMEVSGRVLGADGRTPAPNVILYVYHTDAKGLYVPDDWQTGSVRQHGRLRGWMRTNARGEYAFRTIRPAPYPGRSVPAHVHPVVKEPDLHDYYVDEYRFDDDPLLTASERARAENRGGSGVMRLTKSGGVWSGTRDIVLGRNVPDHPAARRT